MVGACRRRRLGPESHGCRIHRDDLVRLIVEAIRNPEWSGVYNATAPNPVRMGELCAALGSVMGRPSFVPVPDFALKTLLGEGAQVSVGRWGGWPPALLPAS